MRPVTFDVRSETDHLRQVIVHTPGAEMDMVSPLDREALLFEDILFLSHARKEHELMCAVFEKVIGTEDGVLQISTMLREALELEDARFDFVEQLCEATQGANLRAFEADLKRLSADELCHFALTGVSPLRIEARPIPNLMFMRDLAAVVGDHIVLSHAATSARARESIIINVVVHHHPAFATQREHIIKLPRGVTFEGGDLLVASPDTVVIGSSERTSFGGLVSVARALFARTQIEHVVMVSMPHDRSCMHLDTIFTFGAPDECVVFPPLIGLDGLNNVVTFSRGEGSESLRTRTWQTLHQALGHHMGHEMTFIPCGGSDPLSQRREQWTDGANLFAVAPGVVLGYDRNERTFSELSDRGYRVVTAEGFLSFFESSKFQPGEKMAIKLDGYELSRGRGGPRCMTMPIRRRRHA
ncbi:MAG: arginine deiminase family protein [Bacteroidetes bacterium]|nr:arginine deiminase family protein [Bacteroidota bacterium]MDA0874564.1 arginine deiminase family protein [Bacteroidota bacterium]